MDCVTLFWSPTKEATVRSLVPKNKLQNINQISLFAEFECAPVTAKVFSILSVSAATVGATIELEIYTAVDLTHCLNAFSFLFSAFMISQIDVPKEPLTNGQDSQQRLPP